MLMEAAKLSWHEKLWLQQPLSAKKKDFVEGGGGLARLPTLKFMGGFCSVSSMALVGQVIQGVPS